MTEDGKTYKPISAGRAPATVDLEKGKTYYFCTCGYSKNQPFCDGAHKTTDTGLRSLGFSAIVDFQASLCMCKHSGETPFCDGTHSKTEKD